MSPPAFQLKADPTAVVQRANEFDACNVSSPEWEAFALRFNSHFKSILHVFENKPGTSTTASSGGSSSSSSASSSSSPAWEGGYSEDPGVSVDPGYSTDPSMANESWEDGYSTDPGVSIDPGMSIDPSLDASSSGGSSTAEPQKSVDTSSGKFLTGETLSCLFSVGQRDMLMDYFDSKIIPDRLFNGDETNATTAQQRILMAGQILSVGEYAPGSFYQRVHARFCGHWAKLVWHYAGATPGGNVEWAGVAGNLDHAGNIVLGNGKDQSIHSGRKSRTFMRDVDPEDIDKFVPEGSNFAKKYHNSSEEKGGKMQRYGEISLSKAESELKAGDWLYLFNGNSSGSGNHSVIFSRWAGASKKNKEGIRYRKAMVFSQTDPKYGGQEHSAHIGDEFRVKDEKEKVPKIQTVTKINRVAEDAGPADSVLDVLGGKMSEGETLSSTNQKYEKNFLRKHKAPLNREALAHDLWMENNEWINQLAALDGDRLTDKQESLLREANDYSGHVENLVRLNRRLLAIVTSVNKHDTNVKRVYEDGKPAKKGLRKNPIPGLNEQYDEQRKEADAKLAELQEQLDTIDAELNPIQSKIDELEAEMDRLGYVSEIKELKADLNASFKLYKSLPKGDPQRKTIMADRKKKSARKKELVAKAKAHDPEVKGMKKELGPLKKQVKPLNNKRKKIVAKQAEIDSKDPWAHVHPGNNKDNVDKTYNFKGDFQPVRPYETSGHFKKAKEEGG
ncbi:MAG: hypothetical protein AAF570_02115 [Bacteroidota bacterium]